jgi:ABC-type lipoprotein release transport system permease subunit
MFGVGVGAMAIIIVLSAFNGINNLVESLYSRFDAEIRIEAAVGKTFDDSPELRAKIIGIPEVESLNRSLEETVLLKYRSNQAFCTIKGVDTVFIAQSGLDSLIWAGEAELYSYMNEPKLISGFMVAEQLGLFVQTAMEPVFVYAPKSTSSTSVQLENAFYIEPIRASGVFAINQDIDSKYVLAPLDFVEKLLSKPGRISAYELKLIPTAKANQIGEKIQEILGPEFQVKTRFQQNELLYKTNNTEKWATFLILTFILLIATFNIIGSLTILILDKKRDVFVLKGMGASPGLIERLFFIEGLLISLTGGLIGLGLGIALVVLQSYFGFIPVEGLLVDHYPVDLKLVDVLLVVLLIVSLGSLAALLPSKIVLKRFT